MTGSADDLDDDNATGGKDRTGKGEALEEIHAEDVTQSRTMNKGRTTEKPGEALDNTNRRRTGDEPAQKVLNFPHARARNRKSRGSLPGLSP